MPGQGEDPERLTRRDHQPQVDVARCGTLAREVQFMHACRAARPGARQVGDHYRDAGIEGRLQALRNTARVANVDVLRQGHDSLLTAISLRMLIRHISTLLMSARSPALAERAGRAGKLTEKVGQYYSSFRLQCPFQIARARPWLS